MAETATPAQERDPEWLITPEMRAEVGVERDPQRYEVEKAPIRMYARAVGYTDRIFWDEAAAKAAGYRGLVAPPGFFGFRIPNGLEDYVGAGSSIVSPTSGGHTLAGLNAGQRYVLTPGVTICAGDILTSTSELVSIRQTTTSRGPAIITEHERSYTNQLGQMVARNYGSTMRVLVSQEGR